LFVGDSQKDDPKGKGVLLDGDDLDNLVQDSSVQGKDYQEKLDEMLAASLAAEEERNFTSKASTSAAAIPSEEDEEEDSDGDEEILLVICGLRTTSFSCFIYCCLSYRYSGDINWLC
jgi:DNA excision repair protein ERCC-5